MKVGILGGTFDPIHNAHLMIANKAVEEFGLDKVLIMPSPNPPHKSIDEMTSIEDRIKMIKLAIKDNTKLEFSDFELSRKGYAYSADTLAKYQKEHPRTDLYFILGSDSLYSIDSWYHPEIIFENAHILASRRDDASSDEFSQKLTFLREKYNANISEIIVNISDISSTKIRSYSDKNELYNFVPKRVADYIIGNNLYSDKKATKMTNAEIIHDLKKELDGNRFIHTIAVADTAKKMAESLGENPNIAYLAGLLHDCAKCIPDKKKIKMCNEAGIQVSQCELDNPFLLHGKAGAIVAEQKYHVHNKDILNSVIYHTTGRPNMSLLEKIVFTADYIEPGRDKQPHLDILRHIAYTDIDKTVLMILEDTLVHLQSKCGDNIDENTVAACEYYQTVANSK